VRKIEMEDRVITCPIIISYAEDDTDVPYLVEIPAFEGMTQGRSLTDGIAMAQDYIGLAANLRLENGQSLPINSETIPATSATVVIVSVNIDDYRRQHATQML